MLSVGSEFSGIGLLDYGLHLAGLRHAWLCEADEWRRGILAQRFPGARVLDDVRRVGAGTVERVDVIAGGFPCKGASTAGKRTGFGHPETVLWREMARAIGELRPRYVLVENVANILALHDGAVWGEVLGDLAALGYGVVWDCLPAAAVGAPHRRDRVFAVATYAEGEPERAAVHEADAEPGGGWSRALPRDGGVVAAADAPRDAEGGPGPAPGSDRERVGPGDHVVADAASAGTSAAIVSRERERELSRSAGGRRTRRFERGDSTGRSGVGTADRGVPVEWGDYEPAIRRWEAIHGPAPEPLVRRVDDRGAARVERSRLSALGDGVQIQCGYIAGERILELERERA